MGARVAVRGSLVDPAAGDPVGSAFRDCVPMTRILEQPKGTWLCTALLRLATMDLWGRMEAETSRRGFESRS
jgi:hypothetical protein